MAYIALYWGVMLIGYFVGSKLRNRREQFDFMDKFMLICISALVLLMGLRMGSNEEVIKNLGSIGLEALIITVLLMFGAVASITIARKVLKIDKQGRSQKSNQQCIEELEKIEEEEKGNSNIMTWLIIGFVILGLLLGYVLIRKTVSDMEAFTSITGNLMTVGLCIMLTVIGFDMGLSGEIVKQFKNMGLRILVFPISVLVGTTVMAIVSSVVLPLSVKESLAISYGFGWYTFAPVAIANQGYVIAGAVSFMHNVFRELGGIILIPLLAKKIGYIEVTSLAGVAGMDICMPIVEKATRQDIIVYSFTIGMLESLMVPLLVPLVIGL